MTITSDKEVSWLRSRCCNTCTYRQSIRDIEYRA